MKDERLNEILESVRQGGAIPRGQIERLRDALEYFREQGPGYQTRINAVLSAYVRTRKRPG